MTSAVSTQSASIRTGVNELMSRAGEYLSKVDRVAVPVVFRVGEDDDMGFGKWLHGLVWIMRLPGAVCQAERAVGSYASTSLRQSYALPHKCTNVLWTDLVSGGSGRIECVLL